MKQIYTNRIFSVQNLIINKQYLPEIIYIMSYSAFIIVLVLAVIIYFLSKWILKRLKLGNDKNRKFIAIAPAVILSPLVYRALIFAIIFGIYYHPPRKFDKEKWETNTKKRYAMSKDIIENDLLIGKTKDEIIILLGDDFDSNSENHITYYFGSAGLHIYFLDIFFEDGRVIKVSQIAD